MEDEVAEDAANEQIGYYDSVSTLISIHLTNFVFYVVLCTSCALQTPIKGTCDIMLHIKVYVLDSLYFTCFRI